MKKTYWFGLLVLVLLVSACSPQTPAVTEEAAAPTETSVEGAAPTEAAGQPVQEAGETSGAAECRPYNLLDQILGAQDPNLTPVTEDDHTHGPDDAIITILEFSDFQ